MQDHLPARRAVRLRAVLRPARGRVRVADGRRPGRAAAPDPGRAALAVALHATSCPCRRRRAGRCRPAGRRCCGRPARRAARPAARCGSRTTPPTRRTRSRTGSSRSRWPAPASSASRRSPARRPATWPTRSPPTPRPPDSSPTCSSRPTSRSRRSSPPGSTAPTWSRCAATTTTSTGSAPSSSGEHEWAFVNINMRPYYAEGSKTLAFETAEQLGFELPDRVVAPIASGSLFTKIARGFEEWLELGLLEGELPIVQRRPGDRLLAGGDRVRGRPGLLPPGQAGHDRQVAGDRQPGRRSLRARSGPPHRRLDRLGHRRRDPRGDQAAGADDRDLHRDRRRRHRRRCWPSSPSAATSTRTSGSSRTSPARV